MNNWMNTKNISTATSRLFSHCANLLSAFAFFLSSGETFATIREAAVFRLAGEEKGFAHCAHDHDTMFNIGLSALEPRLEPNPVPSWWARNIICLRFTANSSPSFTVPFFHINKIFERSSSPCEFIEYLIFHKNLDKFLKN